MANLSRTLDDLPVLNSLLSTDIFLVRRAGVDYKLAATDLPSGEGGGGSVTLVEGDNVVITEGSGDYTIAVPSIPWGDISATPTTLAGYGITNAALSNHSHNFNDLNNKPTTLAGYGIVDAALLNHTHSFSEIEDTPTTLAGYGLSVTTSDIEEGDNLYFTNSRVRSALSAGLGIDIDADTGAIVNTSPDQVVALTEGSNITIAGTYPNFTISASLEDEGGGTGQSISNTVTQAAHGFSVGTAIRLSGNDTYTEAQADSPVNAEVIGIVTEVVDANSFVVTYSGFVTTGVPTEPAGTVLYLSAIDPGAYTDDEPTTAGYVSKPVAIVIEPSTKMLVVQMRGVAIPTSGGAVNLTYAPTVNTDSSTSDTFNLTLTGNVTLASPANGVDGRAIKWRIKQDSTGGRTVTLGTGFRMPSSASALSWSTEPNKTDILAAIYNEGDAKWDIVSFVPGY